LVDGRERLATYLAEQTGIKLSGSQVRRILKRKKYSYVWAKYSLRINRIQRKERSLEKLAKYLAIAKDKIMQIWEWDETDLVYESFDARIEKR